MVETIKLLVPTRTGTLIKVPAKIQRVKGRIEFLDSPFALKDEIKAMQGAKWHQYIDGDNRKIWSVKDTARNNFQLDWMQGGNPYSWWEQAIKEHVYDRPLREHQRHMTNIMLTLRHCIIAAAMGLGKSLCGIEVVERSGFTDWWWCAPKSGLAAIEREFKKWGIGFLPKLLTYDRLRIEMEQWGSGMPAPRGVIFDECHRLKGADSKRTEAAQAVADAIRREYGFEGYILAMSGSASPKSPVDWWSQAEIVCPGFLKEGSVKAFEWRLRIFEKKQTEQGDFYKPVTWRDDEKKCNVCGKYEDHEVHGDELFGGGHKFVPCVNEVSLLKDRLKGLVWSFSKEEWLKELPDMIFREIRLEPTSTMKRVAKALAQAAPTAIQGLTWLRELSDGFQYKEVQDGTVECPCCRGVGEVEAWECDDQIIYSEEQIHVFDKALAEGHAINTIITECDVCKGEKVVPNMVRETKEVPTPKDKAIRDLLDENDEQGRIVIFAGFQGSIDRIVRICLSEQWNVVKVDGRGWKVLLPNGEQADRRENVLDHWADMSNRRVAFVAHPESGGMGLTLTEARMAVFYSNDFKPESRIQAMARIHRLGMDTNAGATIVDLFHLPTDERVKNVLDDNRRLELMTLEEFRGLVE